MKEKVKSLFISFQTWQIILFSIIGAVFITDLITALISVWFWHVIQLNLMVLGTINAILVPSIILPWVIRSLSRTLQLEEQNRVHVETISRLEARSQLEAATQRRADEMSLLYQLGILFAAGQNLHDTLLTLRTEILKLIEVDTLYIATYNEITDIIEFPIFFEKDKSQIFPSRRLSENPGLTGAIVYSGKTLYIPDATTESAVSAYSPVGPNLRSLRTFLGIPLVVSEKVIGVLSAQSQKVDAYSSEQIRLMENISVLAATSIDKASVLDQLKLELAERKHVEDRLREREAILEAVTFAAEEFLKMPDWRVNIDLVLERLGKTLNATHAYLFEDHTNPQGEPVTSMRYEWTAHGYQSDLDSPYFQNSKIQREGFEEQVEALMRGEARMGNSSTFNPIEKEAMDSLGVKAILEVPIFINERVWGAIGFDDFEQERTWNNVEVDALKIAAGILSAAIQRQEAESAVRASERIYRQAIEAAGAVPYYRDYKEDRYRFMGSAVEKIIGYKPEEITIRLLMDIMKENIPLGEGQGLNIDDAMYRSRKGDLKIWKSDMRITAKNGEERWVSDSAVELFDDTELSYASVGILQDVTDRKQTEANLRKREATLEAITFSAEQFLKSSNWREKINLVLEKLGRELNASHAYLFEKHRGENGELLSSMTYEWTAPDHHSDLADAEFQDMPPQHMGFERMYEILDGGEPLIGSASLLTKGERAYLNSINVKALLEMRIVVNGEQWGTIGFDDVIHEREWTPMEVDVIRVAANVLGAAIKRQLDDAALQKELDQRKKLIVELENKNGELERFTYTVSHDLKSPLVTINGFLGYLEQDALAGNIERLKHDTQRIREAVQKMQNLLNELLELSRIGRVVNAAEDVSLNELVREALYLVNGQLEARQVTMNVQNSLPLVSVDKPRLIEVLQNLLDNAAKYMGDQVSPHIEIGQRGEEQGQPVFYIKDNGIGIAPEFHERIFGLFNKLDPKSEGTGVGLALVKRIIEVHGGRIWLESEAGNGSTFLFSLPPSGQ